ncbi:hypothetical protein ACFVQ4_11140 [Streptomyces laurentii]|uniref:hypothetical protein n=1 Tax=Streptomyces laurentii TaxID=39478 RepID=UPI003691D077
MSADTVAWERLFHAYGAATDTREILAGPLAAAEDHLWSAILHQGTVWPATAPVLAAVADRLAEAPVLGLAFIRDVASSVRIGDAAEELRGQVAAADTAAWTAATWTPTRTTKSTCGTTRPVTWSSPRPLWTAGICCRGWSDR